MELAIYSIYQVDVRNLVKNKLGIAHEYHIQPSEIDRLQYYEYEIMLDEIKDEQKKEAQRQKEQEEQYQNSSRTPNMNNIMRQAQTSMPKMPNYGSGSGFKMPSVSMPSMPKI